MSTPLHIQTFLRNKFRELKINRVEFIKNSGISQSSVSELLSATQTAPSLINIIRIADYFNCSIDEILGRKQHIYNQSNAQFIELSTENATNNAKLYLLTKIKNNEFKIRDLAKQANIGCDTLAKFLKADSIRRGLSLKSIISLADSLEASIDQMIGRTK